jgi:HEAT repeat protein
LRKIKVIPAPHLILVVVVFTATLFLIRRLHRTPKLFAEESLARNIIKRWEWEDMQPPKDLHEAFLIHTIRSRESARGSAQGLSIYKDAVRETLANGFVTRDEMHLLESLRNQLQIKPADHEKVMAALAEEERALINDPSKQISAEKRLQLETYSHALKKYLEEVFAAEGNPDESFIVQLRAEYCVTKEEHAAVLDQLLDQTGGMAARLAEELRTIARAAQTNIALELRPSPTHDFLAALLRRRQARAVESLLRGLSFTLEDETRSDVRDALCGADEALRESVVEKMHAILPPAIAEQLVNAYREAVQSEASLPTLTDMLHARLENPDPYVRAASLYALGERGAADAKTLERLSDDEHLLVRETAQHLIERKGSEAGEPGAHAGLITIEKMIALRSAPIFQRLAPEGLAQLARACLEAEFAPGENLCVEGEQGNEVFILLTGDVKVWVRDEAGEKFVNSEKAGGFIGELAVLDPAPRSATVRAGDAGTRVLRLDGEAFRQALDADPSIASGMIHTLARRLRATHKNN